MTVPRMCSDWAKFFEQVCSVAWKGDEVYDPRLFKFFNRVKLKIPKTVREADN